MESSTFLSAFLGGLLIGMAALLLLAANGQIAGISGILGCSLRSDAGNRHWRWPFLLGLLAVGFVNSLRTNVVSVGVGSSTTTLVVAGLLVGFGTQLGSGCTSGHGICGLGRRSKRSLVAVCTFMATGMLTVFFTRHLF